MLDGPWRILRDAIRALRASRGLAAAAILSLALGIGANTAIFSLINAVVLRSLPVTHPEELLQVTMDTPQYFSNPIWEQIRDRQDVFSGIFAYGLWQFNLASGGEARYVNGDYASGEFFETLGVRALIGRTLKPADDKRGCPGAAVLAHGFWQREYGGRGDVLGKPIRLNGHPMEIVGVTGPGFTGVDVGHSVDVIVPLCAERIIQGPSTALDVNSPSGTNMLYAWLRIIGRPGRGVSPGQVSARLRTLAPEVFKATVPTEWRAEDQDAYRKRPLVVNSAANGLSYLRQEYGPALAMLMAIVGAVLLIACANVANLLLARGAARQREIAIRMALGCGRRRILLQLLTESLLLSAAGAALGIALAKSGTQILVRFLDVPLDTALDLRVLAFAAAVAVLTGLLFGIAPAWRSTQVDPQAAMKAGARGVIAAGGPSKFSGWFSTGRLLVFGQVALSLLLVTGAGLMLSTFRKLATLDAGFNPDRILLVNIDLRNANYARDRRPAALREMLDRIRAIPGVQSAAASSITPICGCAWNEEVRVDGYTAGSRKDATVHFNKVSDGYFETMDTPILAGRDFSLHDTSGAPRVAIVNEAMARKYFPGRNPLGSHYRVEKADTLEAPVEIVGVVKDAKSSSLREDIPPTIYVDWRQEASPSAYSNFELRSGVAESTSLITAAKAAIAAVNPAISVEFTTLTTKIDNSLKREQLLAVLSGFFGALALLLATIGLYGVLSYNVARRRAEIGVRMALGATPATVLRMVMKDAAILVGVGLLAGLGVTIWLTRFAPSLIYAIPPNDPLTLALACAVLAMAAAGAAYLPARNAARLDPLAAIREE